MSGNRKNLGGFWCQISDLCFCSMEMVRGLRQNCWRSLSCYVVEFSAPATSCFYPLPLLALSPAGCCCSSRRSIVRSCAAWRLGLRRPRQLKRPCAASAAHVCWLDTQSVVSQATSRVAQAGAGLLAAFSATTGPDLADASDGDVLVLHRVQASRFPATSKDRRITRFDARHLSAHDAASEPRAKRMG